MTINDRVQLLIDKVAASKAAFSTSTGISTVILSHIISGRNKVSLSAVEQILLAYPTLNAEWLILGKGAMYKEEKDTSQLVAVFNSLVQLRDDLKRNYESADSKIYNINKLIESIEL